jgi:hypothetical protein
VESREKLAVGGGEIGDCGVVAGFVGEPLAAEFAHAIDDRQEGVALFGQDVFDARRNFGEAMALDHFSLFEPFQPFAQCFWADAVQRALKLAKTALAMSKIAEDQRRPFISNDLRGPGNRTAVRFCSFHHSICLCELEFRELDPASVPGVETPGHLVTR